MKRKHKYSIILAILLIGISAIVYAASVTQTYGSHTALTITNLNSLASSATAGWQSIVIDNRTTKALDYEICVILDMANTAAANDKAIYVYLVPAYHTGAAWVFNDGGTATLPSGAEGTYTLSATTHNLIRVATIAYTATDQVVQKTFNIGPAVGYRMMDGFSLVIINFSGAAISASGNMVAHKPIAADVT